MLILFIFILISLWFVFLRWTRRRKINCFKQFKNDIPSLPLVGHSCMLIGNGEVKMKAIQTLGHEAMKQGGVTTMQSWILDKFYAVIADAEIAEIILKNCLEKDDSMKMFKIIFGNGLLVSPVTEWRQRRKILNPIFSLKYLNQNVDIFQKNNAFLVQKLQKESENGPIPIYDYAAAYSLDSVFESVYGFEIGAQKNPQHPLMNAVNICCQLVSNRICLPWLHNKTLYGMTSQSTKLKKNAELVYNFIDETIVKKCREIEINSAAENMASNKTNQRKSMLELMVETFRKNNEPLSDIYLQEETFIVTFAATETTSIALSFTLVLLSRHPYIQEKVYQEVIQVVGDNKPVEAEDLTHLKYTEAVIKETLRMYPPAPVLLRKIDKDITLPSGKNLVAGTGAMINVWAVHHNPLYWKEPEHFRPERFLESAPKHPAAFLPFSYGARNCIGFQYAIMSLKTSVASLIRQYRVLPTNGDPKAELTSLRVQFDVIMRDVDNFPVQFVSKS